MSADSAFPAAPGDDARPSHAVMEHAAQWYALLISGEASAADQARWQAWLASHPHHRQAWQYVESVSQRVLAPLQSTPDPRQMAAKVGAVHARARSRRRVLAGIGALAGAGFLGWAARPGSPAAAAIAAWTADYRTGTGDIRRFTLADGSQVWLNTASALNADMRAGLRRLTLAAGEILVSTAQGDARPFVIDTPQGRMRALGTRFTVRREPARTFLAVYEGAVEIRTADTGAAGVVPAGRQTWFDAGRIAAGAPADAAREAWTRGELIAWDLSLADVIGELGRYHAAHISLAPDVAQRRVFGTFPLRDVDGALAMLAEAASLQVRRPWPWWISVSARTAQAPST
ncbi:FecR domain-containing protein [Bordetella petrii]|uniref:FecR domain-containing protein n=1 Tax=Bordetella petrii TaxID=94624 RepID=UPI001A968708|nr:FecR domain-containing protein [Bordetella petrii]MBO1114210.1 FecR domain-containing protein [Bordetella petrii]